jgi:long-chain fatty acid transport protein
MNGEGTIMGFARAPLQLAVCAGLLSLGVISAAKAGGFARGSADIDTLFEEENFDLRIEGRAVAPTQKFSVNVNPALVGTNFYDNFLIPSAALKFNLNQNLRCEGTFTENVGASIEYAAPTIPKGTTSEELTTNEFGAACLVRFDAGPGVFSVIGGVFAEDLNYHRINDLSIPTGGLMPAGTTANLNLDGQEYGWRAGLAYEIPEIKARAEILYRSGTDYGATGTLTVPGALVHSPAPFVNLPATAEGNLPESVEFIMRSGVAPTWLVFADVKWMDWSVLKALIVTSPLGVTADQYNWRDGWTVTGGVVHSFGDQFAGQVSLTWDRGVGTGWNIAGAGDIWTLAIGGRLRGPKGGEFRGGIGLSYLDSVTETQYANAIIPGNIRSGFNSATDSGFAATFSMGYIVQW